MVNINKKLREIYLTKDEMNESIMSDTEILMYDYLDALNEKGLLTKDNDPVLFQFLKVLNIKCNRMENLLDILYEYKSFNSTNIDLYSRCLRKMIKIYHNGVKNISDHDLEVIVRSYNYTNITLFHSKLLLNIQKKEYEKRKQQHKGK